MLLEVDSGRLWSDNSRLGSDRGRLWSDSGPIVGEVGGVGRGGWGGQRNMKGT